MEIAQRYGFMREVEADLVDRLLAQIQTKFGEIRMIEVGVFGAGTTRGVYRWAKENNCPCQLVGVDFEQYRPNPTPDANYEYYAEDSMDAWRSMSRNWIGGFTPKYNLLFVDGCHCVNHSMCDFLNYSPFISVGGFALFHDTALPTSLDKSEQEAWPQDHSYAGKPSSVLGVRDGLRKLGLLQGYRTDWKLVEEIPSDTGLMGMCLFQKVFEL